MKERLKDIFSRPTDYLSKPVKRLFALPLIYIIYLLLSLFVPTALESYLYQTIRYILFIISLALVSRSFLNLPFRQLISEKGVFRTGLFLRAFFLMMISSAVSYALWMLARPSDFEFVLDLDAFIPSAAKSLVLVFTASFFEELLYRSYAAYFVNDTLETDRKKILIYCAVSSLLFAGSHLANPELSANALYALLFYLIEGFAFMYFYLIHKGIEVPFALHLANNLIAAWFFSYDDAVLSTQTVFIHHNSIGPMLIAQALFCLLFCHIMLRRTESRQ